MTLPSTFPFRRRVKRAGLLACVFAQAVLGCGPEFEESYFAMPGEQMLQAPEGFFAVEIARLTREIIPARRAVATPNLDFSAATLEAETSDLRRALAERGFGSRAANEILWGYKSCRGQLAAAKASGEDWRVLPSISDQLPPSLPAEFRHYFRGAEAWARGLSLAAQAEWEAVLALPAPERHYRSTWAAFMLGRTALADSETEAGTAEMWADASKNLRLVRALAGEGYPDPLGLAVASLGWEARGAAARDDFPAATRLYLEQHAAGDDTALESLRRTAAQMSVLAGDAFSRLAGDAGTRQLLTAYVVARGGPHFYEEAGDTSIVKLAERWALTLKAAGIKSLPDADRLAWLAYEGGMFALAEEWATLAEASSPETLWIRAKLALRSGQLSRSEKFQREALAAPALPESYRARLTAELGRICLAQDDYPGTLRAWLDGEHYEDVAYIAERVMTAAELRAFVDEQTMANVAGAKERLAYVRYLLARRLARTGRAELAAPYFPAELREAFDSYVANVKLGFEIERPAAERAAAFWRAAEQAERDGMNLLGTELDPDWRIRGGYYSHSPSAEQRLGDPSSPDKAFAPTSQERERLGQQPAPRNRFQYRYRAAELAWWAASLLPNESDEAARILSEAGGWLKSRDPEAAKPFYQALVIRCGQTELGKAAAARRWFP